MFRGRAGEDSEHARASVSVQNAPTAAMQAASKNNGRNRKAVAGMKAISIEENTCSSPIYRIKTSNLVKRTERSGVEASAHPE